LHPVGNPAIHVESVGIEKQEGKRSAEPQGNRRQDQAKGESLATTPILPQPTTNCPAPVTNPATACPTYPGPVELDSSPPARCKATQNLSRHQDRMTCRANREGQEPIEVQKVGHHPRLQRSSPSLALYPRRYFPSKKCYGERGDTRFSGETGSKTCSDRIPGRKLREQP
jgi:hypothetical protein